MTDKEWLALRRRQRAGDQEAGRLAPATVNRRLTAIRSLVKLGRTLGMVGWGLEVEGVRSEAYRDTKGPGRDGFGKLLARLQGRTDPKALRDRAALRLLFDLTLRRGEVVRLDVEDLDLQAGTVAVLGKGRREKATLTLPGPTREALRAWLAARGQAPGPLFPSLAPGRRGRLTGSGLYRVIRGLGAGVGLRVRPHMLRHSAMPPWTPPTATSGGYKGLAGTASWTPCWSTTTGGGTRRPTWPGWWPARGNARKGPLP
jgi:integrase/recombinase XerC